MLPGKTSLRAAIKEHGGLVADIARHYRVTRQTVYNWLDHYNMRDELVKSRHSMRDIAKDIVYQRLFDDDKDIQWEASRFVLTRLQDDGELLALSPITLALLSKMGIPLPDVVAEFEAMIQAEALQNK
jgi:transposase-like protein